MATQNILHIPDELLPELQTKAQSEGKTVDEIAVETLRNGLDGSPWQALLAYGLGRGREQSVRNALSVAGRDARRLRPGRPLSTAHALHSNLQSLTVF